MTEETAIFKERSRQIHRKGESAFDIECDKDSLAGAVSQRACVFCGSRGRALSHCRRPAPGPRPHRLRRLYLGHSRRALFGAGTPPAQLQHRSPGKRRHLRRRTKAGARSAGTDTPAQPPKPPLSYSTCIVGIIGDDLEAVCAKAQNAVGIPVIPVQSEGFKGNKREGYEAACKAMMRPGRHGRYLERLPAEHQYPGGFQPGRRNMDHPRLFRTSGSAGGGQYYR